MTAYGYEGRVWGLAAWASPILRHNILSGAAGRKECSLGCRKRLVFVRCIRVSGGSGLINGHKGTCMQLGRFVSTRLSSAYILNRLLNSQGTATLGSTSTSALELGVARTSNKRHGFMPLVTKAKSFTSCPSTSAVSGSKLFLLKKTDSDQPHIAL